jgi:hypothetical protein
MQARGDNMTALVQELLDNFDQLTDSERMDLTVEILKQNTSYSKSLVG